MMNMILSDEMNGRRLKYERKKIDGNIVFFHHPDHTTIFLCFC